MQSSIPNVSLFPPQPHLPVPSCHMPLISTSPHIPRATSISGSGAEFPEQVAGDFLRKPRRRRSVAGIDQEELVHPEKLADPDSLFFDLEGVKVHHKVYHHDEEEEGTASTGLPVILLHGFGASLFSWRRVMQPLARAVRSKVLAFDRPAFGLTSRERRDSVPINPYSMAFSVLATLSFVDMLGTGKAILMGHSAGCLVAVNAYFEAPEKVAALILVAPAIVAPLVLRAGEKTNDEKGKDIQIEDGGSNLADGENLFFRIWKGLRKLYMLIAGIALQILKRVRDIVSSLFSKVLCSLLRSAFAVMLVRLVMDKFGVLAVRNAWYDASGVTDHVVQGYTKPLRAKGWEMALLEYTIAMLTDSALKSARPLTKRLSEITCPVLIVTGDTDRIVPAWNAVRLSKAIPGSTLEVIKNCGHLPHEERVEEFIRIVERFMERIFGAQQSFHN
ncbi:uncharacterized protein M6B38_347930 [Iris pallida]|uniref:AB hydrolase-1 domain-containing protein n=1 Tax=Iris pallida TaxID=29817 RepID=A0AAX6GT32_IRIPA|nr:uncharacterized protein M6B38_347930 [Iris pallida]